jgi:hypothetical protein
LRSCARGDPPTPGTAGACSHRERQNPSSPG